MRYKILLIFYLAFLITSILIGVKFTSAQNGEEGPTCPPCSPSPSCFSSWREHRCTATCDGELQHRDCTQSCNAVCTGGVDECGCCKSWACVNCSSPCDDPDWGWITDKACHPWQKCDTSKLDCYCDGSCLETPENPRYYDNPNYPTDPNNPETSLDSSNIKLPIKLDWEDVEGWKDGWIESGVKKDCPEDCVKSYVIRILEQKNNKEILNEILSKSEYNLKENKGPCFLKPDTDYILHVKACCNPTGGDCGPESTRPFHTAFAPELIFPNDPDWSGSEEEKNVPFEEKLKWCSAKDFYLTKDECVKEGFYWNYGDNTCYEKSFKFLFYLIENDNEVCHPHLQIDNTCTEKLLIEPGVFFLKPEYPIGESGLFTKSFVYAWQVANCKDQFAHNCSEFSQKWRFSIGEITLAPPKLFSPPNNFAVGLPVTLKCEGKSGTNSYIYEISGLGQKKTLICSINLDYPQLSLDSVYTWKVQPCWDFEANQCENIWSETYTFTTTGRPPTLISPEPNATDISIPVDFNWEDVAGAESYVFNIKGKGLNLERPIENSEFFLDYPDLVQETEYTWQVKTCARSGGDLCGKYSSLRKFKTFKLKPPTNPQPKNNATLLTTERYFFFWDEISGAKYYQFKIKYINKSDKETKEKCSEGEEKTKTISKNSIYYPLECKGEYQWQVQGCLDEKCDQESAGEWNIPAWEFTLISEEAPQEMKGGLIPCGRSYDNPGTPWDETDRCQPKDIFKLLHNILNFFLWTVIPIILILLVVATGAIFYFSFGQPDTLVKIKSLWRAAGIGLGIIFFTWIMIDIILKILGYNVGVFGPWYKF